MNLVLILPGVISTRQKVCSRVVSKNNQSFCILAEVLQITGSTMQLIIRSQESYVLDFCGNETLAELKARIAEHEKTDDVILYVSGKPLPEDGVVTVSYTHLTLPTKA